MVQHQVGGQDYLMRRQLDLTWLGGETSCLLLLITLFLLVKLQRIPVVVRMVMSNYPGVYNKQETYNKDSY